MWLGQTHGPGPNAAVHVRQVLLLKLLAGMGVDGQAGTRGQHRIQTEGEARRVHHLLDLCGNCLGHAHTAVGWVATYTYPAAFGIQLVGFAIARRRADRAIVPVTAFFVAAAIERADGVPGDLAGVLKYGL